ncbi:MAG: hypothetical protein GF315_02945 [candidate division Zixibacteria bacterium]|nr:hypothetical protein [candidate division Zixibacteria bacterium]
MFENWRNQLMAECNDRSFKDLLHAYEMGILSEDERKRVEIHLLKCESCFETVQEGHESAQMMKTEGEFRAVAGEYGKEKVAGERLWNRLKMYLFSPITLPKPHRIATVFVIFLIVAFSVYKFGIDTGSEYRVQQVLKFYPNRAVTANFIELEQGGVAVIEFVYGEAQPGQSYRLQIKSLDSEYIVLDSVFSEFNDLGRGSVSIPVEAFTRGFFRLQFIDPESNQPQMEYRFRVE